MIKFANTLRTDLSHYKQLVKQGRFPEYIILGPFQFPLLHIITLVPEEYNIDVFRKAHYETRQHHQPMNEPKTVNQIVCFV
jgi:hypothetical protein